MHFFVIINITVLFDLFIKKKVYSFFEDLTIVQKKIKMTSANRADRQGLTLAMPICKWKHHPDDANKTQLKASKDQNSIQAFSLLPSAKMSV